MSFFLYENRKIFYEQTGEGSPLLLLHGNTASSKMFMPILPILSTKYRIIIMDFLGCGQSERLTAWPVDLWYQWGEQAAALCKYLGIDEVKVIGCSGGALAGINMTLEHPELVTALIADSFEGISANSTVTEQIRMGRKFAKQNEGFCSMLQMMHGDDWEKVLDMDTETVVAHAQQVAKFFHKSLTELKSKLLLTGSAEDEMFPKGHYEELFKAICSQNNLARCYGKSAAGIVRIDFPEVYCIRTFFRRD